MFFSNIRLLFVDTCKSIKSPLVTSVTPIHIDVVAYVSVGTCQDREAILVESGRINSFVYDDIIVIQRICS